MIIDIGDAEKQTMMRSLYRYKSILTDSKVFHMGTDYETEIEEEISIVDELIRKTNTVTNTIE